MAAALGQAEEGFEVIETVAAGFGGEAAGEHHTAEAALTGGGEAESGPFGFEATVPIIAEVVGHQGIVLGVLSKSGVDLTGIVTVLSQVSAVVAEDSHRAVRDVDVVVEEHAEGLADRLPAFHELAAQLNDMDRVAQAVGLCINDYPACSVFHDLVADRKFGGGDGRMQAKAGCSLVLNFKVSASLERNPGVAEL